MPASEMPAFELSNSDPPDTAETADWRQTLGQHPHLVERWGGEDELTQRRLVRRFDLHDQLGGLACERADAEAALKSIIDERLQHPECIGRPDHEAHLAHARQSLVVLAGRYDEIIRSTIEAERALLWNGARSEPYLRQLAPNRDDVIA